VKLSHRLLLFLLLFVCLVVFQIGCWHKDSKNPVAVAPASNMVSNVLFKIVMPPRQNASFSASIVSAVENQPLISFQLKLANFDNPSTPFSIIKKQFPVQNGVATITFESLPATTVVGTLQITNGNIDGYANFHGAADLNQETNIVELAPVGSLMPQDVVANSVSEIVSSTTLLLDAPRSLATELTSIVSSLPLDSNDVYDEVINNFTNRTGIPLVELTAPGNNPTFYVDDIINIVASATDLDGNISSVEFYKNSTKINETNSSPFSFAWQPKATGTYDLWAKVIDNNSAVGVSAPITVNVISAPAYAVTYDGNGNSGGTVPTANQSYQQNATVTVTDNTGGLTKTGYSFAGWNTAADGSGTDYNPGSTFSMGTANVTLYAQWSVLTYTVAYDGNGNTGGTVPTDNQSYQQNATVTVTDNTGGLTKTGYSFAGWNTAADGSGTDYNPSSTFSMGTANVTLYAQWSPMLWVSPIHAEASNYTIWGDTWYTGSGSLAIDGNQLTAWTLRDMGEITFDLGEEKIIGGIKAYWGGHVTNGNTVNVYVDENQVLFNEKFGATSNTRYFPLIRGRYVKYQTVALPHNVYLQIATWSEIAEFTIFVADST
jgi:uncharacterized repeat protein (TIGR02543 family)